MKLVKNVLGDDVIEFLRILFFAKIALLTPQPIDFFDKYELNLQEPLIAITRGASIEINVSSMLTKSRKEGIVEFSNRIKDAFPAGSIEAKLTNKDKQCLTLRYSGNYAYSKNEVLLILDVDGGVPTDIEFDKLIMMSRIKLKSVYISWKNYKK